MVESSHCIGHRWRSDLHFGDQQKNYNLAQTEYLAALPLPNQPNINTLRQKEIITENGVNIHGSGL